MEKNMQIPRGKPRKALIAEVSLLIRLFNCSKKLEPVAIHMLQYFCHYYSRSHHSNQKTKNIIKYLNKRMEWYKHRNLQELISECEALSTYLTNAIAPPPLPYERHSSSTDCARELFNGSNKSASLVDCTRK